MDRKGNIAEAETLYKRAVAILQKTLGSDHADTRQARGELIELQKRLQR